METEAKVEAAATPAEEQRPEVTVRMAASTDPHRALADIALQRAASRRRRILKRAGQASLVLGVLGAALLMPRFREHGLAAAPAPKAETPANAVHPSQTAPVPVASAVVEVAAEATPAAPEDPTERCEADFKARHWRAAKESCSAAFGASPSPLLAMRAAHAHWARGDAAGAASWARNALELGSADPDAHLLIGNAEHAAGNRRKAIAAYRRYLELAPRGWHAERLRSYMRPTAAAAP